jgi:hypothetical protein
MAADPTGNSETTQFVGTRLIWAASRLFLEITLRLGRQLIRAHISKERNRPAFPPNVGQQDAVPGTGILTVGSAHIRRKRPLGRDDEPSLSFLGSLNRSIHLTEIAAQLSALFLLGIAPKESRYRFEGLSGRQRHTDREACFVELDILRNQPCSSFPQILTYLQIARLEWVRWRTSFARSGLSG